MKNVYVLNYCDGEIKVYKDLRKLMKENFDFDWKRLKNCDGDEELSKFYDDVVCEVLEKNYYVNDEFEIMFLEVK